MILTLRKSRQEMWTSIAIFVVLLVCYAYTFPRWADPNQNSRLDLVAAVVDKGTLRIDDYVNNTVDYAKFEGHYYSDKAPGAAFLGIPVYAALKGVLSLPVMDGLMNYLSNNQALAATLREGGTGLLEDKVRFAMGQVAVTFVTAMVPTAILGVLLYRLLGEFWLGQGARALLALIYGLATPAFAYAGAFYGHQLAAACLFIAFYLVFMKRGESIGIGRLLSVGFLLGYAVITEYPAVLIAGILFLYTLYRLRDRRRIMWVVAAGIPPGILLAAYNFAIFRTPLPVGYSHSELWVEQHHTGFMSLTWPHWSAVWGITFGLFRGLFILSPVLLVAVPGFVAWWRTREWRVEWVVALTSVLAFFLFNASSIMWWGGYAIGPRYLLPMFPFMVLAIAYFVRYWGLHIWAKLLIGALSTWSVVAVWGLTLAGQHFPTEEHRFPLWEYAWPAWRQGNIARNAGMFLRLPGLVSLLPLVVIVVAVLGVLFILNVRGAHQHTSLSTKNNPLQQRPPEISNPDPSSPQSNRLVSNRERVFVWAVIVGVLALTTLPYLYGYLSCPPDKQFMGLMLDVPDHGQYLSWFRGFQSSFLVSNKLTPEPNEPVFFNLLWWTLAQIARFTGLSFAPLYQAFRWVSGAAFLWVLYRFIAHFVNGIWQRRAVFLLTALSSGLGWILVVLKYTLTKGELLHPLDVYIAEGNTFLCILGYPHFIFAAAFIVGAFTLLWQGYQKQQLRYAVLAGVVALILGLHHAYDLIILYGVWGAFFLLMWLRERRFPKHLFWSEVILGLISFGPGLYAVYLTSADPLWDEVLAQFANAGVYTPDPFHLLILFGLPLAIAALTWTGLVPLGKLDGQSLFICAWFGVGFLLNYIPTDFQIHMLNSWQVPMMILVMRGIRNYMGLALSEWLSSRRWAWSPERISRCLMILLVVMVLPTNLYLWAWRFVELRRHDYPYYLYRDEVEALNWLDENANPADVVLSSITVGQYVPAVSGNTAFLAHWAQTVDFYDKTERVERFFDVTTPEDERIDTLRSFNITYVFYGPAERALGEYDPGESSLFAEVFSSPHVKLYAVQE
jgi:hypothetical protein